jgi:hypothetical protein
MSDDDKQMRKTRYISQKTNELMLVYDIDKSAQEQITNGVSLPVWNVGGHMANKPEKVLREVLWLEENVWNVVNGHYNRLMKNHKYTGAQLLEMYLKDLKKIFEEEPRYYVLDSELKSYFRRYSDSYWKDYSQHLDFGGCRKVMENIYRTGMEDQTLKRMPDPVMEADFLCRVYFGFLSRMARIYEYQPREALEQIDSYIDQVMSLYGTGKAAAG